MLEKGKIDGVQMTLLVILFLFGTTSLLPTGVAAGQDVWIVYILATLYSIILMYIYSSLLGFYPGQTLIEILPQLTGKVIGKALGFIYVFFYLHLTSLVLRNISDFMASSILVGTPIIVFPITYLALAIYTINKGIETVARVSNWFFMIVIFILIINVTSAGPDMTLSNLFPILENGYKPIIAGLVEASGFPFGETVVMMMVTPFLNPFDFEKRIRFLIIGLFSFFAIITVLTLRNIFLFGPIIKQFIYPNFVIGEYIQIGNFLEDLAPFFLLVFLITVFVKTLVSFYACVLGLAQLTGLRTYRPLTYPLALIIATLSIAQFETVTENADFAFRIYPLYIFPLSFLVPLVLLIIARIKKVQL